MFARGSSILDTLMATHHFLVMNFRHLEVCWILAMIVLKWTTDSLVCIAWCHGHFVSSILVVAQLWGQFCQAFGHSQDVVLRTKSGGVWWESTTNDMSLISNCHHHAQLATRRISPCSYLAKEKTASSFNKYWKKNITWALQSQTSVAM
jgi:hypothetical protein